ncbi:GXYLT2 family protein [Megaselia abdita]
MRLNKKLLVFYSIITFCLVFIYFIQRKPINEILYEKTKIPSTIYIGVVSCSGRSAETLTLLKSALIFREDKVKLHFIIITESSTLDVFEEKLSDWREILPKQFNFTVLPTQFPEKNEKVWRTLFKPCAAQRLFLPTILKDIDSLLYMDTDTLFLYPPSEIWSAFSTFNASQLAGLVEEHEDRNVGWYNRFARHPFYGAMGLNSGVMLMNLTRMREFEWEKKIFPIYDSYKNKIIFGDQDLINIFFYYFPDKVKILSCVYNYRPDYCMYSPVCNVSQGIRILHGNRGYFHQNKQPLFKQIFDTIQTVDLRNDSGEFVVKTLNAVLSDIPVTQSRCGKISDKILLSINSFYNKSF